VPTLLKKEPDVGPALRLARPGSRSGGATHAPRHLYGFLRTGSSQLGIDHEHDSADAAQVLRLDRLSILQVKRRPRILAKIVAFCVAN
jgi:hypothetical protein